ncbi:hypothetical protein O3G_MSEX004351 [Manduca sexta]|uniref:RING-type domain-containing protein n=2 Tax=Manduca sexta TaxID=7130 RepID=A0A921YVD5_MANSE|nr:hypothetical protein O3G_MSEX004351 [Manduca sexta]
MVTSNKLSDKKVVKMADHEHNNIAVVPQRTLLGEVNEHITCPLCRGYYIDATTIVECLHSFCRSCIIKHLQVKSYCPVCEMMINSAKPNIKLDKALQDIVYKLVPGLFQKEMERRQQFYASRPGTAAAATPEQRGEDTERIIFSPEDVISFSLEYADLTDADSISSKSSDSNESQSSPATTRRYLQCPAVVNISHLKKFLSMKFDIDSTQFAIDILYKRVPLSDYYTLMDIAYIFNWKRNEPMRFFYQIIDYVAIRNRLFDINRKGSHYRDRKSSPASTEDTNVSSPAPHLNDQGSEASSGTDSPMPDDSLKHSGDTLNKIDKPGPENKTLEKSSSSHMSPKKSDEDVEKSQFLNSFELTAKSNCMPVKTSPSKSNISEEKPTSLIESTQKKQINSIEKLPKAEEKLLDSLKRKNPTCAGTPELKKLKVELEKAKISNYINNSSSQQSSSNQPENSKTENTGGEKKTDGISKGPQVPLIPSNNTPSTPVSKEIKQQHQVSTLKQVTESPVLKRLVTVPQNTSSPKRKPPNEMTPSSVQMPSMVPKAVSPLKLHIPKLETQGDNMISKPVETPKPPMKKMPDLKPSGLTSQTSQAKSPTVNKVRMDLLANNSDPTIDRSKILSQVKSSLSAQSSGQSSGDPLKSLFDSCKINIPSSLSITLTDQKLDNRGSVDASNVDVKKNIVNKNIAGASNISSHKAPSPPVHNYIEILKLPDTDPKKQMKTDNTSDIKCPPQNKPEGTTSQPKFLNKSSESSAKGPIPNLKPIADTKLVKQSGSFAAPITFQQTFEQQLQSMQCDKKTKLPKNKTQVPKLVPAKSLGAVTKSNHPVNKPALGSTSTTENKTSAALDLSTPHNVQTQLGSQQTYDKALETMQTIANLARKQNIPSKGLSVSMPHNNVYPSIANRTMTTGVSPLRLPSTSNMNQIKIDKINALASQTINNRQDTQSKTNQMKLTNSATPAISPLNYQIGSHAPVSTAQPSPRSQTRSPSSSPKLVIAEEKQSVNSLTDHTMNQSNQITSTQLPNLSIPKSESPKASPGPSKSGLKPVKPLTSGKVAGIWQPLTPTMKTNPAMSSPSDYLSQQMARQMEVNAWIKAHRQYEYMKNMSSIAHQADNDFNNQDKQ